MEYNLRHSKIIDVEMMKTNIKDIPTPQLLKFEETDCNNGHYKRGSLQDDEDEWICERCGVLIKKANKICTGEDNR